MNGSCLSPPAGARTPATFVARTKGLVSRSWATLVGSVILPASRSASTSREARGDRRIAGSAWAAKRALASVYSCAAVERAYRRAARQAAGASGAFARGVPSNSRPQPIANKVSPTNAIAVLIEDQRDVAERVAGDFDHPPDMIADAQLRCLRTARRRGRECSRRAGPEMVQPVASLIARLPPVWSGCQCVFHTWVMRPAAALGLGQRGRGIAGVDDRRLAARLVVDEPDVIVGEGGDGDDFHDRARLSLAREDRQRVGGELAGQLGGRQARAPSGAAWPAHIGPKPNSPRRFGGGADRGERGARQRIGRSFVADRRRARRSAGREARAQVRRSSDW